MTAEPKAWMSLEEYLELEERSEERHEYLEGVVYQMAGGSPVPPAARP